MPLSHFHPAVQAWFQRAFPAPTQVQLDAWPAIQSGKHTLIAAPTGSGKTLAAFLTAIDSLVQQAARGYLEDATQIVYVSPLKALSNDVERNLQVPLAGITEELLARGIAAAEIRALVRTGDTSQADRSAMRRRAPHILVTTPESLYLLLTSSSGREMLRTTRTVIVDEIHAVATSKRGSHLSLTLERLRGLCGHVVQRIGLSATQKPIEAIASFLTGEAGQTDLDNECLIVNSGHIRERDIQLMLPDGPLEAVMSNDVWQNVYDKLAALIEAHHTTLIFANTRRMVERVARQLTERLGDANVAAHHGSLARETRFDAEQRLKAGKLRVLVATASLELGIDIGDVDLVCQLGSPRSIATFLQRVGRANHSVTGIPKGRLFPLSRDELVDCTALLHAVRRGELDRLMIPQQPLDVLAQQIVAEVAAREYGEAELYELVRRAWPYRNLARDDFDDVVRMLAEGFATRRGRQGAYVHRDAVNQRLRARKGARLTAITCGGAIPDNADYQVILAPQQLFIGTLNEDFAVESQAGDIIQLGNASYRIQRVEAGRVRVEDAKGQPPTLPFWLGEAPARSYELSQAVAKLRDDVDTALERRSGAQIDVSPTEVQLRHPHSNSSAHAEKGMEGALEPQASTANDRLAMEHCMRMLMQDYHLNESAARQLVDYLGAAKAILGKLPTQQQLIFERFFDESGGMQLVIHSPFGARVNRAYGLALRKRFCRSFNFELQAAATEDAIILSLGETHSFALEDVAKYLNSNTVRELLIQAMLDSPLFTARWRWTASIALAIKRARAGKRTPAPLQRMAADDLISVIFPEQMACLENVQGDREIPDHPIVTQTIDDCLHEAMDVDGLIAVLRGVENGAIAVLARDLPTPSPLAQEILSAKPYAFLDDAPLEERRAQAVASRRWLDPQTAAEFGKLDIRAIQQVREEAWPAVDNADELHDVLMSVGACTEIEGERSGWREWFEHLMKANRATRLSLSARHDAIRFWVSAERLPMLQAIYPDAKTQTSLQVPNDYAVQTWDRDEALVELLRGRLQASGPTTSNHLSTLLQVPVAMIDAALLKLETQGFALRGQFSPTADSLEWCERRLLARISRYTIQSLRAEIEPVSAADFMRFLLQWHGVIREPRPQGVEALAGIVEQLEGFEVPAASWETEVIPARMQDYDPAWLDSVCLSGRAMWTRLMTPKSITAGPVRATPIALLTRKNAQLWQAWTNRAEPQSAATTATLSHPAVRIRDYLQEHGASFFDDIAQGAGVLQSQAEDGLGELVAAGLVSADSFSGLRALVLPMDRKRRMASRGLRLAQFGLEDAGRWSLVKRSSTTHEPASLDSLAFILLRRYGVVFRKMFSQESTHLPPWHELLRVYRQLEAQGLIRGGRFVAGVTGEQYALPEAVASLRAIRKQTPDGKLVSLSAADPLNLIGTLIPGPRIAAIAANRFLLRDGVLVASYIAGETQLHTSFAPADEWAARNALLHKRVMSVASGAHGASN